MVVGNPRPGLKEGRRRFVTVKKRELLRGWDPTPVGDEEGEVNLVFAGRVDVGELAHDWMAPDPAT